MVVTCVIEFDNNPFCTYYAGQIVTGKVTLQADKPKQVKGIVLKIDGFAHTDWTRSSSSSTINSNGSSTSRTETIYYSGHEDYIKSKTFLQGCEENQTSLIVPGIHTYTFACHLPNNCPSSFEGYYGHIRYIVKVVLIRPWKFNQTYIKGFTVLKVFDLNYDSPLLRAPCQAEAQKTFCCGPCKSQPLQLQVSLPQAGYVPGQAIAVSVLISNETNKKIEELKVELVMRICYYSQIPSKDTESERIVVTKTQSGGLPEYCKKLLNYPIIVPATPPTCFNLCTIIQIGYYIEVTAKVKGWHLDHMVSVPVTVGNVPLMGVIQKQPKATESFKEVAHLNDVGTQSAFSNDEIGAGLSTNVSRKILQADDFEYKIDTNGLKAENTLEQANSALMTTTTPPSPWSEDANIPLPSYEAAMHMKPGKIHNAEKHDYGESEFAPYYPVFNIPSPSIDEIDTVDGSKFNDDSGVGGVAANKSTWL